MGAWPFPGDGPLDIARKVAHAYRTALRLNSRSFCDQIDETMVESGQLWIVPQEDRYEPTDDVTTAEAAELVSKPPGTIRQWACTPHPTIEGRMLLPRFGWRGRERTYLVVHVREAAGLDETMQIPRRSAA